MSDHVEMAGTHRGAARVLIETTVAERSAHETPEDVETTCSFARAERLLRREYHGRFLIELLQNAADAWRAKGEAGVRSRVRVLLTNEPALLVANEGEPFPADAVTKSLGHIGRSTKAQGEAIGHKGIGFKSVLEQSLRPELYSGLASPTPQLAVRFDPRTALQLIRDASPQWDTYLADIDDIDDPLAAVPALRYPTWVDDLPEDVKELAAAGFDTVVRLPFDDALRPEPDLDEPAWLRAVVDAFADVTDEMLLLLGTFEEVCIEDRVAGRVENIEPDWGSLHRLDDTATRELVTVRRNGDTSSAWRLYRRTLADDRSLSGEIAVGLQTTASEGGGEVVTQTLPVGSSEPFHLFFPTRISSGLPFLLHGYFEVNAARTGFYGGSSAHNDAILDALAALVADAVADTARERPTILQTLPDLLGSVDSPRESSAQRFHERGLALLDDVAWVLVEGGAKLPRLAKPTELLVDERTDTIDRIVETFAPSYVHAQTGLWVPSRRIGNAGHRFLVERQPDDAPSLWTSLGKLCRPGSDSPWPAGEEDAGFLALLRMFKALDAHDTFAADRLLESLRGDPDTRLLPAVSADGGRSLLPVPDLADRAGGRRSVLLMARTRAVGLPLVPPQAMDVAFLRDGLLDSETQVDHAKPLGVRAFTVDNVLDRMGNVAASTDEPSEVLAFLWTLLVRERQGEFSTQNAAERAVEFDVTQWFWCRPGHGARVGPEADRQRRRRFLSETLLPTRDEQWRPARELAFGADWAEWLDSPGPAQTRGNSARARSYRELERVKPSVSMMLAPPDVVLSYLTDDAFASDDPDGQQARDAQRHAFLLSLGVWEVIPVEAFESREQRDREPFHWPGDLNELRRDLVERAGGWSFDWPGRNHKNVWVAEDYRFQWSIGDVAAEHPGETARLLAAGTPLYAALRSLAVFCPGCSDAGSRHKTRYHSSAGDGYPSTLALQLRRDPWVSAVLDGEMLEAPQPANGVWWSSRPPSGAGLKQSPLRYLMLCDPDVELPLELRRLADISSLETADRDAVQQLFEQLASGLHDGTLAVAPESSNHARQAFKGLHRMAYERLDELTTEGSRVAADVLGSVGVLCELADTLTYVSPLADARHDDGKFLSYRRYFERHVPFVALPRERAALAGRLGIPPFKVLLTRRETGESRDVTDELADLITDRIPELLAIVVHHSLGVQTLELGSEQFEERATRLRNLRVHQVDDLVIDAQVEGIDAEAVIGEGSDQDLFLEHPSSSHPVLYHDLAGEGWKQTLRRKLAPQLATLLENPAYSSTFRVFLQAETDLDREEVLHEWGITEHDVDGIRAAIGAVSEHDRRHQQHWFAAIVGALTNAHSAPEFDAAAPVDALVSAGMPPDAARRLSDLGGGDSVRSDASEDGALWLLVENGVDLADLDRRLKAAGDQGLRVNVAQQRLGAWLRLNRPRAAAILALGLASEDAKSRSASWAAPAAARFELDPQAGAWLSPVVDSLRAAGYEPDLSALADDPVNELVRLGKLHGPDELEELVARLYDPEEQARMLRAAAAAWRHQLALLGTLARTAAGDTRAAIRAQSAKVDEILAVDPASPAALRPYLGELLSQHSELAESLAELLTDSLSSSPDPHAVLALAQVHGLATDHLPHVQQALQAPRRELARKLQRQMAQLKAKDLHPQVPEGLTAAKPPEDDAKQPSKKIPQGKVSSHSDARKRQLGDEGERWAVAAVLTQLVALDDAGRRKAVDAIVELLDEFTGTPVDQARANAEPACDPDLDEEKLVDALTRLIHVSRYSDGFGFDLIGWLPANEGAAPSALCLEVKSTRDGRFHLSQNEWSRACAFHGQARGGRYAVLAVRRSKGNAPPSRLDLLVDPVQLVESGQLSKTNDGYLLDYEALGHRAEAYKSA